VWGVVFIVATLALLAARARLNAVHVTLVYLLVVQLASSRGGRLLGLTLAIAAFLAFNWFFLRPYGTLAIANALDWLVLGIFLVTAVVAAQLLYRAEELGAERVRRAAAAERARSLEESHRDKDVMLAAVSHDLRTPLTTIKGLAHEIAASGDERAEVIEEEADRLNTFVGKLLDLSRVTTGGSSLDIQPNEAEDLLGAAAQQVQGRMNGRPLRIHIQAADALLFGRFDFAQSLRALVNLIENASKYSPTDAAIDIGARRDGASLLFWVADRGAGVSESERERIFQPFYRRVAGGPDVGGAGLGLSIARGIAEAQGGSVTLAPREGGGSVFTLAVPAIDISTGDGAEPRPS
jgi:two-component system sensor histidine kinase KdpD